MYIPVYKKKEIGDRAHSPGLSLLGVNAHSWFVDITAGKKNTSPFGSITFALLLCRERVRHNNRLHYLFIKGFIKHKIANSHSSVCVSALLLAAEWNLEIRLVTLSLTDQVPLRLAGRKIWLFTSLLWWTDVLPLRRWFTLQLRSIARMNVGTVGFLHTAETKHLILFLWVFFNLFYYFF